MIVVIGAVFTVTVHLAVFLPSTVVTVIVDLPALIPVIKPEEFIVAILVLLDFQVTDLFVALEGDIVGINVVVKPVFRVVVLQFRVIFEGFTVFVDNDIEFNCGEFTSDANMGDVRIGVSSRDRDNVNDNVIVEIVESSFLGNSFFILFSSLYFLFFIWICLLCLLYSKKEEIGRFLL